MLEIKNLTKKFKTKKALDSFSYTFEHGVYGILGPNGAGKTTLMRSVTKLYPIKADSILYNGKCVRNDKSFLSHVGYLPQKFGLFKELSVTDALCLLANLKGIGKKEALARISKILELVNLSDRAGSRVQSLSGGMIRRLGIAQALLSDPEILIFDEPTAGLDPEERLRYKNIVSQIKENKTVIISTHIVEDVEAICDKVVIVNEGRLVNAGSCLEIQNLASGKVFEVREGDRENINGKYLVQKTIERGGERLLKILSAEPQSFDAVKPTVEDGYICALKRI